MVTADQILAHAIGDYILQSHWMATEKTKESVAALFHVVTYGLPFLLLKPSLPALGVIVGTHFVIDRWRLARFIVSFKNWLGDPDMIGGTDGKYSTATGYPAEAPPWLAFWLLIIADNIIHVVINGLALKYL